MVNHKNMCKGKTKSKPNITLRIKWRKIQLKYTGKNADTFTLLTYLYQFTHFTDNCQVSSYTFFCIF